MSTAPISTSTIAHLPETQQAYIIQRQGDLKQLGQALSSGDLAGAQQLFNTIQRLAAQNSPFAHDNAFAVNQRQQDFSAIGQALKSGDASGAQQAFNQLESTFKHAKIDPGPAVVINISEAASGASAAATGATGAAAATSSTTGATTTGGASTAGPEIVLNIGNNSGSATPEQITLTLNNTSSGGEQLTIGIGDQQNANSQQITLNLAQNSNEQIVLNLLGNTPATSSQASGVNVVA